MQEQSSVAYRSVHTKLSSFSQPREHLRRLIAHGGALWFSLSLELVLLFYLLRPMLWSGYINDDVANSQGPMWRAFNNVSIWTNFVDETGRWMRAEGRFFPGSVAETLLVFEVFQSREAYKVAQLAFVALAWASFVGFVAVWTRSLHYPVVAGWCALLALQFRAAAHDPLLSYSVQQPVVAILFFNALTLVILTSRTSRRRWFLTCLAGSTLLWVGGVLTYETLYLLIPLPLTIIWWGLNGRRRRFALAALMLPTMALMLFIFNLRSNVDNPAPGYQMNFEASPFVHTFVYQSTGALPFSYPILSSAPPPRLQNGWDINGQWDSIAIFASLALIALSIRWLRPPPLEPRTARLLAIGGALVLLVPSTLVALTKRWQDGEVTWGLPYISVFLSSLGVVMCEVALVSWLVRRAQTQAPKSLYKNVGLAIAGAVASAVVVLAPLVIYDDNQWVVNSASPARAQREAFIMLVETGAFDDIPDGATLITDNASSFFWENGWFIQHYGGPRQLNVVLPTDPVVEMCGNTLRCFRFSSASQVDGTEEQRAYPYVSPP